jgi:hypothetical protein
VPVRALFPSGIYPEGESQQYRDDNAYRTTATECRERERLEADLYNNVRQAAEVHRQVRKYVRTIAKPGVKLFDMCERLEDCVRRLIEEKGLEVCSQWVGAVRREVGGKRSKGCRKNRVTASPSSHGLNNAALSAADSEDTLVHRITALRFPAHLPGAEACATPNTTH